MRIKGYDKYELKDEYDFSKGTRGRFYTPLEISTDNKKLIISPVVDNKSENDVLASLNKINGKFSKTLKRFGE